MTGYTGTLPNGEAIHYVDRKRWLWSLSVLYPLQPFAGITLHAATGNELWLLLPFLLNYAIAPILDMVFGVDTNNPPEQVVMQLERDPYYRRLTYIVVPLHFLTLIGTAWYAGTQDLSAWAFLALAVVAALEIRAWLRAPGDGLSARIVFFVVAMTGGVSSRSPAFWPARPASSSRRKRLSASTS